MRSVQCSYQKIANIPSYTEVNNIKQRAKAYSFCKNLVIIGMGGALLNPSAVLHALYNHRDASIPNLYFTHYIDQDYLEQILCKIKQDINYTVFLVISNSGYTAETLEMTKYFISIIKLHSHISQPNYSNFIFVLGDNIKSPLHQIAQELKAKVVPYTQGVGGRFSSFSNSVLWAMTLLGLEAQSFCIGGKKALEVWKLRINSKVTVHVNDNQYLQDCLSFSNNLNTSGSSSIDILQDPIARWLKGRGHLVYLNYIGSLHWYYVWVAQMLMETFGKTGKYPTVINAMAPLYSHGQLENYLYIPADKTQHIIEIATVNNGVTELNCFASMIQETVHALKNAGHSVQVHTIDKIREFTLGYMMMLTILKVVEIAHIFSVDPFSQPALDKLKYNISL